MNRAAADAEAAPSGSKQVLFVCVGNSARSLMAEAIFNADPPSGWRAISAGTRPAASPHPRTGAMLREIGLELPSHPPQPLTPEMIDRAGICISMGCLDETSCPVRLASRPLRDWGLPDPAGLDEAGFREVRDRIRALVDLLRHELAPAPGPSGVPGSGPAPDAGHPAPPRLPTERTA